MNLPKVRKACGPGVRLCRCKYILNPHPAGRDPVMASKIVDLVLFFFLGPDGEFNLAWTN